MIELRDLEVPNLSDLGSKFRDTHLAKAPEYAVSLCGIPRGSRPLKPNMKAREATCIVCRDLAGLDVANLATDR